MTRVLVVALGGALGSAARYGVAVWASGRFGTGFPYGTLIVNLLGCFLMGLIMHLALTLPGFPVHLRLALTTGVLGGLTTYSAFNYETTRLISDGAWASGLANLGLTLVGCALAGLLGIAAGKLIA